MITPEVMLLKIDQIANKPIPITAKTEEKIQAKSSAFIPQVNKSAKIITKETKKLMYLNISFVRPILKSPIRAIRLADFLSVSRHIISINIKSTLIIASSKRSDIIF